MSKIRQLAAIMFTDIQGYTALMQRDEELAIQAREKHRSIFNSSTKSHHGRVLQYYGDGTLSIFDSAIDAVQCAIEMQVGFQADPQIPVRIGIHTGEIVFSEEEIIGDSVNVASRIESLAVAGSVLVSDKVYDELKNQASIQTVRLKTVQLKNIARPVEVYAIANPGLVVPDVENLKGKTAPVASTEALDEAPSPPQISFPILATKLYVPTANPQQVHRTRLIRRLDAGINGKMSLVAAPAGFGKTTLVSDWVTGITRDGTRKIAWLSLEEADSDRTRFLHYLIAALQAADQSLGTQALAILQSPQAPPTGVVLTSLVNELAGISAPMLLVLDDYHLIESRVVDEAVSFLIEHLPPAVHIAITTRVEPALPLPRLRARRQLTEVRANDLRFDSQEAADFLNGAMGLQLTARDIDALEHRTEGWIAGLQLAAISMQGQSDRVAFIQSFTGSHRFVLDYLAEEVLQQLSPSVREFLIQTSILERLSAPLCDAVRMESGSQEILAELERANLFVIPLDDRREWYRYHHLFADVLRARISAVQAGTSRVLHLRASQWFEQAGMNADAMHHAFAAQEMERTGDLLERFWPEMNDNFQTAAWMNWVERLPEKWVRERPLLVMGQAWAMLNEGELEAGIRYLDQLDQLIKAAKSGTEFRYVEPDEYEHLEATAATARSFHALAIKDLSAALSYAEHALKLLPESEQVRRGPALALLGLAKWSIGELESAYRSLFETMEQFRMAGNLLFAISGTYGMADIRLLQGRLDEANRIYTRARDLVEAAESSYFPGVADIYLGLADLAHERGEIEAAQRWLAQCEQMGEPAGLPDYPYRMRLFRSRMHESVGEWKQALLMLEEARQRYYPTPIPLTRPIEAIEARIWIRQGRLLEAQSWAEERALEPEDELTFLNEFEHMVLARLLIAEFRQHKAVSTIRAADSLLKRLAESARSGGRFGNLIEIYLLSALAAAEQGDVASALDSLTEALALGEAEGYFRIFTREGTVLTALLDEAIRSGTYSVYAAKLRAGIEQHAETRPEDSANQQLIEPLSERELEVLSLIAKGYSNQAICDKLFLALPTIKGHNRNIFGKLGVKRRTEAVARARELGLI